MKIKNEEVKLQLGNKKYILHNLILNAYIKKYIDQQLERNDEFISYFKYSRKLNYILLKFDEQLIFDEETILQNTDFDIALIFENVNIKQTCTSNRIITEYFYNSYSNVRVFDYSDNTSKEIKDFNNRKITAIGFNTTYLDLNSSDTPVCSVIDTANYNLYLLNDQKLTFSRKDIVETDGIFKSDLKNVTFPLHLSVAGIEEKTNEWVCENHGNGYGKLKSIGLSTNDKLDIEKEFYIEDIGYTVKKNNNRIEFNEIDNYLSIEKLLPNSKILPLANLYPLTPQYKYIVFKYAVIQNDIVMSDTTGDSEYPIERGFYYVAYPISRYGKSKIYLEYERS